MYQKQFKQVEGETKAQRKKKNSTNMSWNPGIEPVTTEPSELKNNCHQMYSKASTMVSKDLFHNGGRI